MLKRVVAKQYVLGLSLCANGAHGMSQDTAFHDHVAGKAGYGNVAAIVLGQQVPAVDRAACDR